MTSTFTFAAAFRDHMPIVGWLACVHGGHFDFH
jgi:hypothetical protein